MENQANAGAQPQEGHIHSKDCNCDEGGSKDHAEVQGPVSRNTEHAGIQGSANSNLALFVIAGIAVLFGGYLLFGIFQGGSPGATCSADNLGACPIEPPAGIGGGTGNSGGAGTGNTGGSSGGAAQDIYIRALSSGTYDKQSIQVQKGVPVRLHFSADPNVGCGRQLIIYGLNVRALSTNGQENVVEFTPNQAGTYEYNCGMRMFRPGKLTVL